MRTTNILIAILCLAGLTAPVSAQGTKKALPAAVRALTRNVPVRTSGTKSFAFPNHFFTSHGVVDMSQLNATLQHNIAHAKMAPQQTISIPPLPVYAVLSQGIPEKTFLELTAKENVFYQQEMQQAIILLSDIKALQALETQDVPAPEQLLLDITQSIVQIKNDYLRNMALNLLEDGNIEALKAELTQYYSLGMAFEEAAFNYTLRHPHKRNLQTMRLLHNPFIAPEFKEPVQAFINQPFITVTDKEAFKQALHNLQAEYNRMTQNVTNTPAIKIQIEYYKRTISELSRFVKEHNKRLPKWNTRNKNERDLHNRVVDLMIVEKQYNYEPFVTYHKTLRQMWEQYKPKYWSKATTLQKFEEFIQSAPQGYLYPRACQENSNISLEEEQLFDNLMHWRTKDEGNMNREISRIQARYLKNRNLDNPK